MQKMSITGGLVMAAIAAALVVGTARPARAQDAELVKKGEAVYDAQKCQVCHSVAGKGSKTNPLDGVGFEAVGRRHPQLDRRSGRGCQESELHQEAADAGEVQASTRRARRARRLHVRA